MPSLAVTNRLTSAANDIVHLYKGGDGPRALGSMLDVLFRVAYALNVDLRDAGVDYGKLARVAKEAAGTQIVIERLAADEKETLDRAVGLVSQLDGAEEKVRAQAAGSLANGIAKVLARVARREHALAARWRAIPLRKVKAMAQEAAKVAARADVVAPPTAAAPATPKAAPAPRAARKSTFDVDDNDDFLRSLAEKAVKKAATFGPDADDAAAKARVRAFLSMIRPVEAVLEQLLAAPDGEKSREKLARTTLVDHYQHAVGGEPVPAKLGEFVARLKDLLGELDTDDLVEQIRVEWGRNSDYAEAARRIENGETPGTVRTLTAAELLEYGRGGVKGLGGLGRSRRSRGLGAIPGVHAVAGGRAFAGIW